MYYRHVGYPQDFCRLFNEAEFFTDGIHEYDLHIRPENGQNHPRETGAGPQIQKAASLWEIPGIVYSQRIIHILNETFPAILNTCEVHHLVLFHYQFIVLFKACRYGFIALDMQCVKHVHACHLYSPLCCLRNTISTVISAGDTPEILAACPRDSGRILSSF